MPDAPPLLQDGLNLEFLIDGPIQTPGLVKSIVGIVPLLDAHQSLIVLAIDLYPRGQL